MADIILTHGFFLDEDKIEQQIMCLYPPLGILYISNFLRKYGWKPFILDTTFITRPEFEAALKSANCNVLGIYTTHITRSSVIRQIRVARSLNYTIILGGPDSVNYEKEYLEHGADIIVIGEGEAALKELLERLNKKISQCNLEEIKGVAYRSIEGKLVKTLMRTYLDIGSIPWPDRENIDIKRYLDAWKKHHGYSSINVITSRGCRFGCRWCSHAVFGNNARRRDPVDCANEIQWISEKYNPDQIYYADDVFTMDSDWIFQFSNELKLRNIRIPFEAISRADKMLNSELVKELALMGCRRIWIGSESGSNRMLKKMGRGVTAEQIKTAIELSRQNKIQTGMFVMWGYEDETPEDIEITIDHVIKTQPDIFFTTTVHPIKNTPYYQDICLKIIHPNNWACSNDKSIIVKDQKPAAYYEAANNWLRNSVKANQSIDESPEESASFSSKAEEARKQLMSIWNESTKG